MGWRPRTLDVATATVGTRVGGATLELPNCIEGLVEHAVGLSTNIVLFDVENRKNAVERGTRGAVKGEVRLTTTLQAGCIATNGSQPKQGAKE
jgi:hypothetical protein